MPATTIIAAYMPAWKDPPEPATISTWGNGPWINTPPINYMGDHPERWPSYGAGNEDDQTIVDLQLQIAASAGITAFSVNWYAGWANEWGIQRLLSSTSSSPVKAFVQWSNHYASMDGTAANKPFLYEGIRLASLYMVGSYARRYYRRSGHPVLAIFSTQHLDDVIRTSTGHNASYTPTTAERSALVADMRNVVGNVLSGDTTGGISGSTVSPASNAGPFLVIMDSTWNAVVGVDAMTMYSQHNIVINPGAPNQTIRLAHSYAEIDTGCRQTWGTGNSRVAQYGKEYWPTVMTGWDRTPWGGTAGDALADNCKPTADQYLAHCLAAQTQAALTTANGTTFAYAFNENGESYPINPTSGSGTMYVDTLQATLGAPTVTAPTIFYTDWVAGPTTGGHLNSGCFLSIFGTNLGDLADYVSGANKVLIGGVEVANYRCLVPAVGSGAGIGRGVFDTWGVMCLTVQVGALGSPTAGVALKLDLTVGGVHPSNPQDGSGSYLCLAPKMDGTLVPLTFTPQPGPIFFLDRVNGSDANDGLTPTTPKKTLQGSTGFTGLYKCASGAGATDGMKPGTHVYDMGGTANANGLGGFAAYLFRISGTLPTGGTNRGPICYTRYPGAVGANAPADVVIQGKVDSGGNGGGGFNGNDTAKAAGGGETNPYDGLPGWGRSIHISNVKIISSTVAERNGAPVNLESGGDDWRVVNCDLSMPWVGPNVSGITNAGGIVGNGVGVWTLGNWIHDVYGVVADNQNHGIYIDGSLVSANGWVAFMNCIYDCRAGNGIQTYNSQASDSIQNISIDTNWVEKANKHGLNVASGTKSRRDSNNIVIDSGEAGYCISTGSVTAANGIKSNNNVVYGFARVLTSRSAFWNQGGNGSGAASTDHRNNIYAQKAGSTGTYSFVIKDVGVDTFTKCIFYDYTGHLTTVSSTFGVYHDPGFVSTGLNNFALATGSFCIDDGAATLVIRRFDFFVNPVSGTPDVGAIEYATAALPAVVTPPVLGGTASVGQASTATQGTWSGTPTSYAYQWYTSLTATGTLTAITGATANTRIWLATDQGKYPAFTVTATNAIGSTASSPVRGPSIVTGAPNTPHPMTSPVARLERAMRMASILPAAIRKTGRMTCSGKNILDGNGNPFVIRGFVYGHGEVMTAADPAQDATLGANTVRFGVRTWGLYSGTTTNGQLIGGPGNLIPAYLAYVVANCVAIKRAGLKLQLFFDSNCGQNGNQSTDMATYCTVNGNPGQNFWTADGQAQFQIYLAMVRWVVRTLRGLIDFCEPISEPNAPNSNQLFCTDVIDQIRTAILIEDPEVLIVVGGYPGYANKNIGNAYDKPEWKADSNTIMTCDELSNAMSNTAGFPADVTNIVNARNSKKIPAMVNQAGVTYLDDPTGSILDSSLSQLDNASGGSIGYTIWEKVSAGPNSYGPYNDNGGGRTLSTNGAARLAIMSNHFKAPKTPAT